MRDRSLAVWGSIILGYLFVLIAVGCVLALRASRDSVEFTLTERVVKRASGQGGDKYLLYTDRGVFQNTDSVWAWKFRSSDLQAELRDGGRYRCETQGWRIPFLSEYRNVLDCEPVVAGQGDAVIGEDGDRQ